MTPTTPHEENTPTPTSETSHIKIKKDKNSKKINNTNSTPVPSKNLQAYRDSQIKLRTTLNTQMKTKTLSHDDTILNEWEEEEKRIMNLILKKRLKNCGSRRKLISPNKTRAWNMDHKKNQPKINPNQTKKHDIEMDELEIGLSNIDLNIKKYEKDKQNNHQKSNKGHNQTV